MGKPETSFFEEAYALKEEILAPILDDYQPRVRLGRFSWPWPSVTWYSAPEAGSQYALLTDSAMRWGGKVLFEPSFSSGLTICEGGIEGIATSYRFDFKNSRMRKNLNAFDPQQESWLTSYRRITGADRQEAHYGIDKTAPEDYAVVLKELKCGASGLYIIENGKDGVDDEN